MDGKTATDKKRKSNVRSGFALSLTFFVLAMLFSVKSDYFGSATTAVGIIFVVIGFMGLGIDLNKVSSRQENFDADYKRGTGIFDNIGIGVGFVIAWLALLYYFPSIWIKIPIVIILMFGVYAILLGMFNGLLEYLLLRKELEEQRIDLKPESPEREALRNYNSNKFLFYTRSLLYGIGALVGFLASILTILQILKIIG